MDELFNLFDEMEDKEASDLFENLPDGEYMAVVSDIEHTTSKSSGKPMVKITWQITHGEYNNRLHWQYLMLVGNDETQTKSNLQRLATTLRKFGINTKVKNFDELFEQLPIALGKEVKLTLETRKGNKPNSTPFTNTSFEVID